MPKPLTVYHNKLWKILQEREIPDHLTCLLRNLYAGQEATVRTGHGTTDWFQIGKGLCQGCILSPCLFNFYAEYIMRKAGLDEAEAGIKIAGRNINNFRYADDTTLVAESVLIAQQIFKMDSLVVTFIYSLRHPCWVSLQLSSFAVSLPSSKHNLSPSRFIGAGTSLLCSLPPTVGPHISFSEWSYWMPHPRLELRNGHRHPTPHGMCVCVIFSTLLSKEILLILFCAVIISPISFISPSNVKNSWLQIIFFSLPTGDNSILFVFPFPY